MKDTNDCRFSGPATNIRAIQTRTGRPMTVFLLQCWKENIKVCCFNGLAEKALGLDNGSRVELSGQLQISEKYGAQIVAKELNGEVQPDPQQEAQPDQGQPGPDLSQFDYQGGPF